MYTTAQWYFNFLQHAMKSYVFIKIIICIIRYDSKVMGRFHNGPLKLISNNAICQQITGGNKIDRNLSHKNR